MISKNWPTELKKMSESQTSVVFRRRSRSKSSLEQVVRSLSVRSLIEDISSSSDNLTFIGLSSKNANASSSPVSSKDGRGDNDKNAQKSSSGDLNAAASASTSGSTKDNEKKEKKRKALSSSRQKKFFRHFPQVNPEEPVINYFSCALVSDILLQGHMYITENYFAFYSNVFGFVTKLLIPVVSVVRISKEKTAKIIPNAIGVATLDERHVFGSFMSREAAYRLMLSIWRPAELPETPTATVKAAPVDVEISECSIEEDSSCSVSGNESPKESMDQGTLLRNRAGAQMESSSSSAVTGTDAVDSQFRQSVEAICKNGEALLNGSGELRDTKGTALRLMEGPAEKRVLATATTTTVLPAKSSSSREESRMFRLKRRLRQINLKFPTDIHIVYLGVILAIVLALFSGFLLYRIMDIQSRTGHMDYNWKPNRDVDVYEEVLKWQREIQERSVEETQNILNINLEQILKVRKSLESLSSLITGKRDSATAKGTVESVLKT